MLIEDHPFITNRSAVNDGNSIVDDVSRLGVLEVRVRRCSECDWDDPVCSGAESIVKIKTTLKDVNIDRLFVKKSIDTRCFS